MALSDKIKALGWEIMQLKDDVKYIACDLDGQVWYYKGKPSQSVLYDEWFDESHKDKQTYYCTVSESEVPNWRELCFSREECEAWVKYGVVIAKSATTSCSEEPNNYKQL